jgi:hypothetical protein
MLFHRGENWGGAAALAVLAVLLIPAPNGARAGLIKLFSFQADYVKNADANAVDYALAIPFFTDKDIITKNTPGLKPNDPYTRGSVFDSVSVRNEGPRGANGVTLFFSSSTGDVIKPGGADKYQVVIQTKAKTIKVPGGTSTFRKKTGTGNIPSGDRVELVGFNVRGDPQYSINNDPVNPFTFTVHDLEFLTNAPTVADTTPFLDFNNSFGFGPPQSDFTVTAADLESMSFNLPEPDLGNWDFARFKLFVGDVQVGTMVQGFENILSVPEPSALLLGLGGAALLLLARRGRALWAKGERRA